MRLITSSLEVETAQGYRSDETSQPTHLPGSGVYRYSRGEDGDASMNFDDGQLGPQEQPGVLALNGWFEGMTL